MAARATVPSEAPRNISLWYLLAEEVSSPLLNIQWAGVVPSCTEGPLESAMLLSARSTNLDYSARLEGYESLRDEFICPISRELMVDPVIAADGHTYDRPWIQQWLELHRTSPKTNAALAHQELVENVNLRRLIDDLVAEGGRGLYSRSRSAGKQKEALEPAPVPRCLVRHQVALLECMESSSEPLIGRKWFVRPNSEAAGGRAPGQAICLRDDPLVSRSHFRILWCKEQKNFVVKDVASSTGVYMRLPNGFRHVLAQGQVLRLGKHQLKVETIRLGHSTAFVCVGPAGSPLAGKTFTVPREGGTLGRSTAATVSFSFTHDNHVLGVDTAVSMVHARVELEPETGRFIVMDGSHERPSSNGLWLRAPQGRKHGCKVDDGTEMLVGSNRLRFTLKETITEAETTT